MCVNQKKDWGGLREGGGGRATHLWYSGTANSIKSSRAGYVAYIREGENEE